MHTEPSNRTRTRAKMLAWVGSVVFLAAVAVLGAGAFLTADEVSVAALVLQAAGIAVLTAPTIYFLLLERASPKEGLPADGRLETLREWPIIDAMSRTLNRRGITISLLELMALAERYGHKLAVAGFSIDHLEDVEREFGREAADTAVQSVADTMGELVRMPDRIGRYDESSFLLLLPETDTAGAKLIAERVREAVAGVEVAVTRRKRLRLTTSVGVTEHSAGEDMEHLLTRVTEALEEARQQGHNRVIAKQSIASAENVTLH